MDYANMSNEELETLVNNKDGEAICELGERCLYGTKGHELNPTRAYQLFHKGEKMGLSRAFVGLGEMYRNGIRFAKNENLAMEYYQKANVAYPGSAQNATSGASAPASHAASVPISQPVPVSVPEPQPVPVSVPEPQAAPAPVPPANHEGNAGVSAAQLSEMIRLAQDARQNGNYDRAKSLCDDLIQKTGDMQQGFVQTAIPADQLELFFVEANWILAFTAFNEQNYIELENRMSVNGVQGLHPWGVYLMTIGHKMMQAPAHVLEQDLQLLIMVHQNQNLSMDERGDVCSMAGDLICEGYGAQSGADRNLAKQYYNEAISCGNEYAKERYRTI